MVHKGPRIFNLGLEIVFEVGLNGSGVGLMICSQDESHDSP